MGAKQSKRSVDISGKEADGAGEVAAAGAGGEGRVEQLADPDALKAQINGDAHIHEQTDKEKELDSGTPENEKDATTEKEGKEQNDEKVATPITNGEGDQKTENGETTPTEEGKKPKKEKVKKKWSLRSISFSRKDKPKQEKKQKEEEPKTNGETEKVPEESVDITPESPVNEEAEEIKPSTEAKEENAPETPVTEPITNGSSTPESLKVETPIVEESVVTSLENDRPEQKDEIELEQLPVNGLSLVEPIQEIPEVESKIEETIETKPEIKEIVTVPEIPVIKEVCVTQIPLIEPSPPPLPANPPPSSVASFAATTMAPELTDASLSNTETTITTQMSTLDIKLTQNEPSSDTQTSLTNIKKDTNDSITDINLSIDKNVVLPEKLTDVPLVEHLTEKPNADIVENVQQLENLVIDLPIENPIVVIETDTVNFDREDAITNNVTNKELDMGSIVDASKESKTDDVLVVAVKTDTTEDKLKVKNVNEGIITIPIVVTNDKITEPLNAIGLEENVKSDDMNKANNIDSTEEIVAFNVAKKTLDKNAAENNTSVPKCLGGTETLISTDAEIISVVESTETVPEVTDDVDDLPPPPPIDDLDIVNEKLIETVMNIPVIILETDCVNEIEETKSTNSTNENDNEAQEEIMETLKESVVDAIEPVQYNGTDDIPVIGEKIVELTSIDKLDDTTSRKFENLTSSAEAVLPPPISEIMETPETADMHSEILPSLSVETQCLTEFPIKNAASTAEESMPPPSDETKETEAAGKNTNAHSEKLPPPSVNTQCLSEEPSSVSEQLPDTAQESVCDKMADLIPDVPAVPELKTEMETSKDVVVAN